MKQDRLHKDSDDIHNLDDLIDSRKASTSRFGDAADPLESADLPEDTDVEEALTFPHPKHKKSEQTDLMSTPHEEDTEDDQPEWAHQELLPTDYAHHYDECSSTLLTDDEDETAEEVVHEAGRLDVDDVTEEPVTERMPSKFTPEESTE